MRRIITTAKRSDKDNNKKHFTRCTRTRVAKSSICIHFIVYYFFCEVVLVLVLEAATLALPHFYMCSTYD